MAQILLLELVGRGPEQAGQRRRGRATTTSRSTASAAPAMRRSSASANASNWRPSWAPDRPTGRVESQPLLDNRRSTGNILSAASRLIDAQPETAEERSAAADQGPAGEPVRVVHAADEAGRGRCCRVDQGRQVRERASPRPAGATSPCCTASHRHRELIVERLRKQDIPYVVVGGAGLFNVADVRDVGVGAARGGQPGGPSASFVRLLSAGPWRLDAAEILRVTNAAGVGRPARLPGRARHPARGRDRRQRATCAALAGPRHAVGGAPTLWTEADFDENEPETVQAAQGPRAACAVAARAARRAPAGQARAPDAAAQRRSSRVASARVRSRCSRNFLTRTNLLHDLIAVETPEAQRSVLALARFMRFVADWQACASARQPGPVRRATSTCTSRSAATSTRTSTAGLDIDGVQLMTVYQAKGLEYEAVAVPRLVERPVPRHA